ncbi:putative nuclease HARBI1 [Ananas comosus]|uniref:Nuclease HARBI1 n=1 Tax=Ananas comosus TaxID=4615 RepID=A0A6P5EFJ7_ANACO|nr:putative nuclease HARBI1 [Ananas comosus]
MDNSINHSVFTSSTLADVMTMLDDDDDFWDEVLLVLLEEGYEEFNSSLYKRACRTRPFSGQQLVQDILFGHPDRGYQHFRMTNIMFEALRDDLIRRGLIQSTKNINVDKQLAIFLHGIGHGVTNRILAETFQHSGETISRHFNNVLRAVMHLKDEYLCTPSNNVGVHPRIRDSSNFHPFKNAIGSVDRTHLPVVVRTSKQPRYRNRKGFTSQNMMAACSFDHQFLFVCTGWEGSAADMRILRWCLESGGFTVPDGKFYLVDSGYANTDKFLAPYRGERYHLSQFDSTSNARRHRSPRDLYNHRHAQLRNAVEKAFGILKKRFKVLRQATPYPYKVQCRIAMACCIIHNFIRRHQGNDKYFNMQMDEFSVDDDGIDDGIDLTHVVGPDESRRGDTLRSAITEQLWNNR